MCIWYVVIFIMYIKQNIIIQYLKSGYVREIQQQINHNNIPQYMKMLILAFNGKCIGNYGQWFVHENRFIFQIYKAKALSFNININHLSPSQFMIIPNHDKTINEFFTKHKFKKNKESIKKIEWDISVDLNGATELAIGMSTEHKLHIDWEYETDQKSNNANYELKIDIENNKVYTFHTTNKPVNCCIRCHRSKYENKKLYRYMFDNKEECKLFIDNSKTKTQEQFNQWSKRQHKQWKYTLNWYYNFINTQIYEIDNNYKSLFQTKTINLNVKLNFKDNELSWFIKSGDIYILINKIEIVELKNDNQKEYRLWARVNKNVGNGFAKISIKDIKLQMN